MNKILIIIGSAAVLAVLFFAGNTASKGTIPTSQNGAAVASALALDETSFDFGSISMKEGNVSRTFSVTNSSDQPVVIKKITTSCMCTEAFVLDGEKRKGPFGMPGHGSAPLANVTVPANGTATIEVVFDPAAHGPAGVGSIERAVFIEDESKSTKVITIKAVVIP